MSYIHFSEKSGAHAKLIWESRTLVKIDTLLHECSLNQQVFATFYLLSYDFFALYKMA